ncbi:CLUMA_CG012717, isoform A [Clunio marinus]|uniref:CLUMA_CG012717, isoform A n=1 Tax=Clunio marinus TaxID=568069 RepID=A0A1J1IGL6_9DIPT|nr:CLUMA_CG012717, isoform A [Clunio marinus]
MTLIGLREVSLCSKLFYHNKTRQQTHSNGAVRGVFRLVIEILKTIKNQYVRFLKYQELIYLHRKNIRQKLSLHENEK